MGTGWSGRSGVVVTKFAALLLVAACQGDGGGEPSPRRIAAAQDPATARDRSVGTLEAVAPSAGPPSAAIPPGPTAAAAAGPGWRPGPDCLATLANVRAAAAAGSLAADPRPPPVAVLVRERARRGVRFESGGLALAPDLPLPIRRSGRDADDGPAAAAPCLLVVLEPDGPPRVERGVTGHERVASAYVSRVTAERNPAYETARMRARRAERRLNKAADIDLISSGDPLMDLVGGLIGLVIGGFDMRSAEREYEQALAELENTPPTSRQPVYEDYAFERRTVRAAKRVAVPVALLDRDRGLAWQVRLDLEESREFRVLDGLNPRDRDIAAHRKSGHTRRDLELWERRPPEVPVSVVVDRLVAARPPAQPAGGLGAVLARLDDGGGGAAAAAAAAESGPMATAAWGATPALDPPRGQEATRGSGDGREERDLQTPGDPRFRSVVRIGADGGSGTGFYVAPDMVVTNDHVVDGATTVDVTTLDGATVLGLVARRDPGRDLALIHVPRPGPPLALYDGPPLEPGSPVEAIGHPRGFDFSLSRGIVSAVRRGSNPRSGGLQDVLLVQTDAAVNRGNSGGPLFSGAEVVGVNTWGVGESSGGLNFAVHYREVLAFLAEAGLRVAAGGSAAPPGSAARRKTSRAAP